MEQSVYCSFFRLFAKILFMFLFTKFVEGEDTTVKNQKINLKVKMEGFKWIFIIAN